MELAVFGALIIGLLATLVNYGLRNKFQQQALQQTFRKAMSTSYQKVPYRGRAGNWNEGVRRGTVSYVYARDRHTPDPTNPFGAGSVSPSIQSVSITRDNRLSETARWPEELPQIFINIPNQVNDTLTDQIFTFTTAGFTDRCIPDNCPEGPVKKYEEIYGYSNFWKLKKKHVKIDACKAGIEYGYPFYVRPGNSHCGSDYVGEPLVCTTSDGQPGKIYRAIDYCEGQIMDYDSCRLQCNKFIEQDVNDLDNVCVKECVRSRLDEGTAESACKRICSAKTDVPDYCNELNSLFSVVSGEEPKGMGLQPDYQQTVQRDNSMRKRERRLTTSTTDTLNRTDTIERKFVFIRKSYNAGGGTNYNRDERDVANTISQDEAVTLNNSP